MSERSELDVTVCHSPRSGEAPTSESAIGDGYALVNESETRSWE